MLLNITAQAKPEPRGGLFRVGVLRLIQIQFKSLKGSRGSMLILHRSEMGGAFFCYYLYDKLCVLMFYCAYNDVFFKRTLPV